LKIRIITYSDLHLGFGSGWTLPPEASGDLSILAGDITTLEDYNPLDKILELWKEPVLYVTGNHEFQTRRPLSDEERNSRRGSNALIPMSGSCSTRRQRLTASILRRDDVDGFQ
jgi:predicted phosphodiesterase